MSTAAIRLAAAGVLWAALAVAAPAQSPPTRPSRPVPSRVPAAVRIGGREYVRAADVAAYLDLALHWVAPGRRLLLGDASRRVEFFANRANVLVDGLTVFLGDPVVERNAEFYVSRTDLDRRLVPLLRPGWVGPPPPRPRVIVLDPGHGGSDSGTENPRLKAQEKTYALDVGLRLRKLLQAEGYEVAMTRATDVLPSGDKKTDLQYRGAFANQAHADLFLSIHFNADEKDARTTGTEVYTFPPPLQNSTRFLLEHKVDFEKEAAPVNRFDPWSAVFAHAMYGQELRRLRTADRGEKLMHLGVLRGLDCPGILVESAFLSNDAEARRVMDPAFRQQIAEAMLAGVRAYVAQLDALRPAPPRPAGP